MTNSPMTDAELKRNTLLARYDAAAHAMQTGVKLEIAHKGSANAGADPKHLRVGVNSALVETSMIVKLLIAKGIITEEEHLEALVEAMEAERDKYTERVSVTIGRPVTLA